MLSAIEPSSAYVAGQIAGQVFVLMLFLAGALKCWSISHRPTTNTKCALGLMFTLLAMFVGSATGSLKTHLDPSPAVAVMGAVLGLGMMGLAVTAMVLAILGLVEYSQRPGVYTQGRAQAIWTLVLTGLVMVLFIVGFVKGFLSAANVAPSASESQPGKLHTFEDLNFQFRSPGRPWVSYDGAMLNTNSKISFMRRSPEVYFFIVAEKLGTVNFSTKQAVAAAQANLQASTSSSRVVSEAPCEVKGLDGTLVETEAVVNGYKIDYRSWYYATNGYVYQLIGYSAPADKQKAALELEDVFAGFALIDPNRIASHRGGLARNFHSPRNHYTVVLTNSPWGAFPAQATALPHTEFAVSQGDSCFAVTATRLDGLKPGLDALVPAFLATFGITLPDENLTNRKFLTESGLPWEQYDYTRDSRGTILHYRFRISQGDDEGYFVAAWTQRRLTDAEAVFSDAFGRVQFDSASNAEVSAQSESRPGGAEDKTRGFILNQAGLYRANQSEYEKALPLYCAAARANPEESVYVVNALYAWQHLDRPKDALAFLDTQPSALLRLPVIKASQAYFQAQALQPDQAATNFAAVFATGYRDDAHFTEYINLLADQKEYDAALAAVQKYLKTGDSVVARLMEGQVYRLKKNFPAAINCLKELHDQTPFNTQVTTTLAETLLSAGRCTEALEISRDLSRDNPDSAGATYLKGRCELGLKWYREAKISLAKAAQLAPANKDIRSYLSYVSGLLGEGDNSTVMDPIEPVALPADLISPLPEPAADYAKKYGAYYIRRTAATAFVPGKEHKTTEYMLARMLDTAGVSAFSTMQIAFDPLSEQIFVNELKVTDPDGKIISSGNPTNYYVLDDRSTTSASQEKILNIPVPGLQPDCRMSLTFTRLQQGRMEEFPFTARPFSAGVPVQESSFFLTGDGKGLKYRCSPEMEPSQTPEGLRWSVSDPLVVRWEPMQPPASEFLPTLWLADASNQWPALATNYLASIADRLELNSALRKKCQQLVEGSDDTDSKIEALSSYVQTNLTYKAIEFGRRARIPNKPAEIIGNKYGDCKDHAVLLQQMLVSAGVPAQLALVNHRGPIQKDLPSLDQFDHMIVFVPGGDGSHFLDCTSKGADVAQAIPIGLDGQKALVLDALNPRFETIPSYSSNASTLSVEQHLRLIDLTDLAVEETLTLTGVHAASLRDYLLPISESARRTSLQTEMGMTDADLTDAKIDGLNRPGQPLQLRFTYTIKGLFHRSNGELRGVLRAGFSRLYLEATPTENRLTPFDIHIPITITGKTSLEVPAGFQAEPPETPNPKFDPRFATEQGTAQANGRQLILGANIRLLPGRFKAADYAAYRATMTQALSLLERDVVLKADGP